MSPYDLIYIISTGLVSVGLLCLHWESQRVPVPTRSRRRGRGRKAR